MDFHKLKLKLLMALLYLLRLLFATAGCLGVLSNLSSFGSNWFQYNTNTMENDKEMEVRSTFHYVEGWVQNAAFCATALTIHIFLLVIMDRYDKHIGKPGPSRVVAFFSRYARFFPSRETKLEIVMAKMNKNLELMNRVAKAQNQLFEAVRNDERYAEHIDRVVKAVKKVRDERKL